MQLSDKHFPTIPYVLIQLKRTKQTLTDMMTLLDIKRIEIEKDIKTGDVYFVLRKIDAAPKNDWLKLRRSLKKINESDSILKPTQDKI